MDLNARGVTVLLKRLLVVLEGEFRRGTFLFNSEFECALKAL